MYLAVPLFASFSLCTFALRFQPKPGYRPTTAKILSHPDQPRKLSGRFRLGANAGLLWHRRAPGIWAPRKQFYRI